MATRTQRDLAAGPKYPSNRKNGTSTPSLLKGEGDVSRSSGPPSTSAQRDSQVPVASLSKKDAESLPFSAVQHQNLIDWQDRWGVIANAVVAEDLGSALLVCLTLSREDRSALVLTRAPHTSEDRLAAAALLVMAAWFSGGLIQLPDDSFAAARAERLFYVLGNPNCVLEFGAVLGPRNFV